MIWIAIAVLCLAPVVQGAVTSIDWCYHDATCNEATWATKAPQYCAGSRQSPIDIVSKNAMYDSNLKPFTFKNFNSKTALTMIENTGNTVKVSFASGVGVSGGGLPELYDSAQFHLHWGNGASVPGSEHTINGKRYPMELHIVSIKSSHNGSIDAAVADSNGAAALGFLIEVDEKTTGQPASWKTLTMYLSSITQKGQSASMTSSLSLDDLLPGVDRKRFYRYLGSLTTPNCQEAVIWTVFKEPVKVSKDLIELFSKTVLVADGSTHMVNTYRSIHPAQKVTHSSSSRTRHSFGLILFVLALWMS